MGKVRVISPWTRFPRNFRGPAVDCGVSGTKDAKDPPKQRAEAGLSQWNPLPHLAAGTREPDEPLEGPGAGQPGPGRARTGQDGRGGGLRGGCLRLWTRSPLSRMDAE